MRLLADMELFVGLVKFQNFSRAAAAFGITASTLSRRITGLEAELGVPLITRSTRSFALTESGQEFYERSKNIVAGARQLREEMSVNFTEIAGHLRIGAPVDLAVIVLAPIVARYCRANPGVSVEIVAASAQPDPVSDSLDVAFVVVHQVAMRNSSFPARPIGSFSRMLYASKTYLARHGTPLSPQHLKEHNCIRHLYIPGAAERHWDLYSGRKHQKVIVKGALMSNSLGVYSQAAREHLGIVMLPLHLASHPAFGAGLVRVLPDWEGAKVHVFALSANRKLPAKTQELINLVKTEFAKQVAQLEAQG